MATISSTYNKSIGPEWNKGKEIVKSKYSFAVQTGAVGDYVLMTATGACVVKMPWLHVEDGILSALNTVTVSVGKNTGGTEFVNAAVEATLVTGYLVEGGTAAVKLAAGDKIMLSFGVEAATAGIINFCFEVLAA